MKWDIIRGDITFSISSLLIRILNNLKKYLNSASAELCTYVCMYVCIYVCKIFSFIILFKDLH